MPFMKLTPLHQPRIILPGCLQVRITILCRKTNFSISVSFEGVHSISMHVFVKPHTFWIWPLNYIIGFNISDLKIE